jgi:hypothetical protein
MKHTNDIIAMAREVGFVAYGEDAGEYRIPTPAFHTRLERFAALVADRCAEIAYEAEPFYSADLIRKEFNCEKR